MGSRCSVVRFEKRAREWICLTSLTRASRKAQGNQHGRRALPEGRRVQARGVRRIRPESERSMREQGEACRKARGGLLELVSYNTLS